MTPVVAAIELDVTTELDAGDIVRALGSSDEAVLGFICQMLAHSHSVDLRERLLERLGVQLPPPNGDTNSPQNARYFPRTWEDGEFLEASA